MSINLKNKVALITGGAHGIGKGCALQLAKAGSDIILNDHPKSSDLIETTKKIRSLGRNCHPIRADVFTKSGRDKVIKEGLKKMGKVDILVTNPASSISGKVLELEVDDFQKTLSDVLVSHFGMAQLVAKQMVKQGKGGKIIFMGSVYGFLNRAKSVSYDSGKAGIHHMTKVFARELAQYGINANAIAPGFTDTPGEHKDFKEHGKDPIKMVAEISQSLPFGRAGTPEDVGNAATFLASPLADYVTGHVLVVDGGMSLVDFTYTKSKRI